MSGRAEMPYKVVLGKNTDEIDVSMVEIDGKYYQQLILAKDLKSFSFLSPEDIEITRTHFRSNNVKTVEVRREETIMLPDDSLNLASLDLSTFTTSNQGETFGNKIGRLFEELRVRIKIPESAIAISASEHLVIILPFDKNG